MFWNIMVVSFRCWSPVPKPERTICGENVISGHLPKKIREETTGKQIYKLVFFFHLSVFANQYDKLISLHTCMYKQKIYQRRVFKKICRTSRPQLRFSNINCQRVLLYLECKSWALWGSCNPQVGCSWSFRQYEEMCNTHWSRNI